MVAQPRHEHDDEYIVMSEADYLAMERESEIRHEYVGGRVYAMAGAKRAHNLICTNLVATFHNQLRGKGCEIYQSDMKLRVNKADAYRYPDVIVVCGEPQFIDEDETMLINPLLLVEVLSPSTASKDRGTKSWEYRQIESLNAYLVIDPAKPYVERYQRRGNEWVIDTITGLDATLDMPSLNVSLALAEVYAQVTFPAADAESPEISAPETD